MATYLKFKGGRRSFHVILFILLSMLVFSDYSLPLQSKTPSSDSLNAIIPAVEYYSPEDIEINRLYHLIGRISSIDSEPERKNLAKSVYTYGTQYSIDPILLLAIARVESNFRKNVVYHGCVGYFQVNVRVHKVSPNFINDTFEQTKKACEILAGYKVLHKNQINYLNGYNGYSSSSNPYARKVLRWVDGYEILYKESIV